MTKTKILPMLAINSALLLGINLSFADDSAAVQKVTVDNYVRAETDLTFKRYGEQGAFGKFLHFRAPTPVDKQGVVRMNRDTPTRSASLIWPSR